jgi:hypothetical protein
MVRGFAGVKAPFQAEFIKFCCELSRLVAWSDEGVGQGTAGLRVAPDFCALVLVPQTLVRPVCYLRLACACAAGFWLSLTLSRPAAGCSSLIEPPMVARGWSRQLARQPSTGARCCAN